MSLYEYRKCTEFSLSPFYVKKSQRRGRGVALPTVDPGERLSGQRHAPADLPPTCGYVKVKVNQSR